MAATCATLDWTLAAPQWLMLLLALGTFVLTAWLFVTIPKGFFPEEDIGQIQVTTEAAEDISFPAMKALQDRVADALVARPERAYVNSFVGVGGPTATQNAGRLFAVLKPRSERPAMPQVLESLRKRFREIPGVAVYMQPMQNLQPGRAAEQGALPVHAAERERRRHRPNGPSKLMERMRADPAFRDVTSDSQNRGLQATLEIDRDKAGVLGVADRRPAHRALQRLRRPADRQHLRRQQHLPGDPVGRRQRPPLRAKTCRACRCATRPGQLVPLSAFSTVRRTVGPDLGQPPGPAAGGDGVVQPRARRAAGRGDREDRPVQGRAQDAAVDHHQLRRRCGGVPELAGQPGGAARAGGAGDLRAAGRAVRELHPSAHHPGRPAFGGGGRAAVAQAVRLRPDADRDHRHPAPDRHRQEERDHDDRLRARCAAHARACSRSTPSARPAACASGRS